MKNVTSYVVAIMLAIACLSTACSDRSKSAIKPQDLSGSKLDKIIFYSNDENVRTQIYSVMSLANTELKNFTPTFELPNMWTASSFDSIKSLGLAPNGDFLVFAPQCIFAFNLNADKPTTNCLVPTQSIGDLTGQYNKTGAVFSSTSYFIKQNDAGDYSLVFGYSVNTLQGSLSDIPQKVIYDSKTKEIRSFVKVNNAELSNFEVKDNFLYFTLMLGSAVDPSAATPIYPHIRMQYDAVQQKFFALLKADKDDNLSAFTDITCPTTTTCYQLVRKDPSQVPVTTSTFDQDAEYFYDYDLFKIDVVPQDVTAEINNGSLTSQGIKDQTKTQITSMLIGSNTWGLFSWISGNAVYYETWIDDKYVLRKYEFSGDKKGVSDIATLDTNLVGGKRQNIIVSPDYGDVILLLSDSNGYIYSSKQGKGTKLSNILGTSITDDAKYLITYADKKGFVVDLSKVYGLETFDLANTSSDAFKFIGDKMTEATYWKDFLLWKGEGGSIYIMQLNAPANPILVTTTATMDSRGSVLDVKPAVDLGLDLSANISTSFICGAASNATWCSKENEICRDAKCFSPQIKCVKHGDCAAGTVCKADCYGDDICVSGCENYYCTAIACSTDYPERCPVGTECVGALCVPKDDPLYCANEMQCDENGLCGYRCIDNTCQKLEEECDPVESAGKHCADGFECTPHYRCVSRPAFVNATLGTPTYTTSGIDYDVQINFTRSKLKSNNEAITEYFIVYESESGSGDEIKFETKSTTNDSLHLGLAIPGDRASLPYNFSICPVIDGLQYDQNNWFTGTPATNQEFCSEHGYVTLSNTDHCDLDGPNTNGNKKCAPGLTCKDVMTVQSRCIDESCTYFAGLCVKKVARLTVTMSSHLLYILNWDRTENVTKYSCEMFSDACPASGNKPTTTRWRQIYTTTDTCSLTGPTFSHPPEHYCFVVTPYVTKGQYAGTAPEGSIVPVAGALSTKTYPEE